MLIQINGKRTWMSFEGVLAKPDAVIAASRSAGSNLGYSGRPAFLMPSIMSWRSDGSL